MEALHFYEDWYNIVIINRPVKNDNHNKYNKNVV